MNESLPPEAGSLHGEIPDTPENREFFKELLKESYEAAIRADEREKIEKKVYAKCYHTKYIGVEPCSHDIIVRYLLGGDD